MFVFNNKATEVKSDLTFGCQVTFTSIFLYSRSKNLIKSVNCIILGSHLGKIVDLEHDAF